MTGEPSASSPSLAQSLAQPGRPAEEPENADSEPPPPRRHCLEQSLARCPAKGWLLMRLGTAEALKPGSRCPRCLPSAVLIRQLPPDALTPQGGWEALAVGSELPSLPVAACGLLKRLLSSRFLGLRMAQPRPQLCLAACSCTAGTNPLPPWELALARSAGDSLVP